MARKDKSLRHGIGTQYLVISRSVHPSAPIQEKYIESTKEHKMELLLFNRESVKVLRRGAAAVPFFFFSYPDFDDGELYAAKCCIHVMKEGSKEYLFDVLVPYVKHTHQSVNE